MTVNYSIITLGIALVASCQTSDPGVSESFALATATSWSDDGRIETEVRDTAEVVVATAEWNVTTRRGTLSISNPPAIIDLDLEPGLELTEASTNHLAYDLWLASSPELAKPYDNFPPSCSAWQWYDGCWYRTCSACVTTSWGEQCAAIGQSDCGGGY